MVLLDVNVLVYACRTDSTHHREAMSYLDELGSRSETIAWHPQMFASLIRIVTNGRVFAQPSKVTDCKLFLDDIISFPGALSIRESSTFVETFLELIQTYNVTGPEVSDYYWAALAIDCGARLCSADQKFASITELSWDNLLKR